MNQQEAKTINQPRSLESTRAERAVAPTVDIYENEHELLLVADLPGVTRDGLKLGIEPPELRLEGSSGSDGRPRYYRAFTIDERVDAANVTAELRNGVLTVRLPKAQAMKPRQIPIRATS
jgi:HSP20 family molecular chaperone IbpA